MYKPDLGNHLGKVKETEEKACLTKILPKMRLNRCILGSGYASILVIVGLQRLRLPGAGNFRRWQHGGEAAGRMEEE